VADTIPGNSSSTAVLAVDSFASSSIDHLGDTDWWQVNLVAGQNYVFDLAGWYSGLGTLFDPYLWVLSSSGSVLGFDDDSGAGLDSRVVFTPAFSGMYFVAAGEAGHDATGTYTIVAATDHSNTLGGAANLTLNTALAGSVQYASDIDLFAVSAPASSLLVFAFDAPTGAPPGAFDLRVYNAGGGLVKSLIVDGDSAVVVGAPAGGTYYFQVGAGTGYTETAYTVTAAVQAFDFTTAPTTQILPLTGDNLVDATLHGYYWNLDSSRTITWALADSTSAFWLDPVNALARVDDALATYETVANVHFQRLGYYSSVQAAQASGADIVVSMDGGWQIFTSPVQWGRAFFPGEAYANSPYAGAAGDVWINLNSAANTLSYEPGGSGFFLLLHELGHALGLKHPHDSGGTGHPTYTAVGLGSLDIDWASVMSYNDDVDWNSLAWEPATPMLLDVLAMQAVYGQNSATNAGDSTHLLFGNNKYQSIWDADGNDTVSASESTFGWTVYLTEPASTLSLNTSITTPVGFAVGDNTFALYPTLYWLIGGIENAIGSNQNDTLVGNESHNTLTGLAGADALQGGGGNDVYRIGVGDGQDAVWDFDATPGNQDVVQFQAGVLPGDIGIYRSGSDIVLAWRGGYDQDRVTLQQFDLGTSYQIEQVTFTGDATVWNPAYLLSHVEQAGTVLAAANAARTGQAAAVSGMFQIVDPDGGSPYSYELWDGGAGGGYFRIDGVQQAAGVVIPVTAAQLAMTDYFGGPGIGSETVYVRAYDGLLWTGWASWTMYTHNRPANNAPAAIAANRNIDQNQWRQLSELVSVSDADGDAMIQYQVRDTTATTGSGYLYGNGAIQAQGATVACSSLADTWVCGGANAGADTYQVRAFDGVAWSGWTSFSLHTRIQPNRAPVVAAPNAALQVGQAVGAGALWSFSDADGDAPFSFELYDAGAGAGHFQIGAQAQAALTVIAVSAAQLASTQYVAGASPGNETLWVRGYDGQAWSAWTSWQQFSQPAGANALPVVNVPARNIDQNQWRQLSELVSVSDAEGNPVNQYQISDSSGAAGSAYLYANGAIQAQGASVLVSAADLVNTWVNGGANLEVNGFTISVFDTFGWSAPATLELTTRGTPNRAPVVAAPNAALQVGQAVGAGALWSFSDADGDAPFSFELYDAGAGAGHFQIGAQAQAALTVIAVSAAQLASTQYVAGASPGNETLWVRGYDGQAWGGWSSWNMSTVA